jgi:hypothetical protein
MTEKTSETQWHEVPQKKVENVPAIKLNTIDITFANGYMVVFKKMGFSEYYKLMNDFRNYMNNEKQAKIRVDAEKLENIKQRTPQEDAQYLSIQYELSDMNMEMESISREIIKKKAIELHFMSVIGDRDEAVDFVDTLTPADIQEIIARIKPDVEKNLLSQSSVPSEITTASNVAN